MALPVKAGALCFKIRPQRAVVVDLTIIYQHIPPTGRVHGLVTRGREIDDGETPVA
jgi:hypothetical protein